MKKNYKILSVSLIAIAINSANAQCPTPTLVTATPSVICAGSTTSLNATAVGASINWFTAPVGGVSLGTSASGANFSISPVTTTTYYAGSASSAVSSLTFAYTGAVQSYTVPAGVTSVTVDAYGAAGYGALGYGGRVQAVYPVTAGAVLQIKVGGAGTETLGGYNGGGDAGANVGYGSGGGASDIRLTPYALADRVIVAGGGGGTGSNCGTNTAEGGDGGGLIGGSGCVYSCSDCQYTGAGGTQFAGGISGPTAHGSCTGNQNGSLGQGGSNTTAGYGTGGGGGYYGGGSGCFEGAGGGSSFTAITATGVIHTPGVRVGNGQVILTLNNPCASAIRTAVLVTVNATPTVSVTSGAICAGGSYTMVASGAGTYTYSGGSAVVTPTANTSYSVTGTSTLGCVGSNTAVSSVTVNANPTVAASTSNSLICVGQSVVLTASTSATSYTWNTGATTMSVSVSPTVTSTYTVNVSNATACVASSTVIVTVSPCTGINEILENAVSVYPNPANGVINVDLTSELTKNSTLEVYDALGKLVVKQVLANELNSINISTLSNGIYTFKVLNNSKLVKMGKLIKE